jgi:hypothetical protein
MRLDTGVCFVSVYKVKSTRISAAGTLIAALSCGVCGCGTEGQGTIKLSPNPRSSMEMPGADAKKVSGKMANAKKLEEEAKKKDPKRY